jgi:TonB family protein
MFKFYFLILFLAFGGLQIVAAQGQISYGQPLKVAKPSINPQLGIVVAEIDVTLELNETGSPAALSAVNGNQALRSAMLGAAAKTSFAPTLINGKAAKAKGVISYKVLENRDIVATFYLCVETDNCDLTKVRRIKDRKDGRFVVTISDTVINSKAKLLENPKIPEEAKQLCNDEVVTVRALIRSENGDVVHANAISGVEMLHQSAEDAALKTKFFPSFEARTNNFYSGLVVYNYSLKNNKPKPEIGKPIQMPIPPSGSGKGSVKVEVIVSESGSVVSAKAISGRVELQTAATAAARQAKFSPTRIDCKAVQTKTVISYDFAPNRETKVTASTLKPVFAQK